MFSLKNVARRLPQLCYMFPSNFVHFTPVRVSSGQAADNVSVTFIRVSGKKVTVKGKVQKSLYDVVIDNNLDIDGFGACEGTLCCTTCHLIFNATNYQKVGPPSDEEMDMLELAHGLTDTSRLGCQVRLRKELEPLEVHVPPDINDIREL